METHLLELALKFLPYTVAILLSVPIAVLFFAIQLWRYGGDIRRLNRFETIAQLAHFADNQKEMTVAFGAATAASGQMRDACKKALEDLESLRDYVADMQEKMSARDAEAIMRERLEEEGASTVAMPIDPDRRGVLWSRSRPEQSDSADPDTLYKNMMGQWDKFLAVFRQRLLDAGITPVMNRIGKMTYALTDRRRRSPMPLETAELITALHSQYRRYTRMQGTRAEWMTRQVHDDFVRLVDTAIRELSRSIGGSEPTTPNGGVHPEPDQPRLM